MPGFQRINYKLKKEENIILILTDEKFYNKVKSKKTNYVFLKDTYFTAFSKNALICIVNQNNEKQRTNVYKLIDYVAFHPTGVFLILRHPNY